MCANLTSPTEKGQAHLLRTASLKVTVPKSPIHTRSTERTRYARHGADHLSGVCSKGPSVTPEGTSHIGPPV